MKPLFIPSKNRLLNSHFIDYINDLLKNGTNLDVYVVVEGADLQTYKARYQHVQYIVLPESNKGISYVRNFIKVYAEKKDIDFYWMVDDDITNIYRRLATTETKLHKCEFTDLAALEQQFIDMNLGICSLEYRQLAWSASKEFVKDSFCDAFVFVNVQATRDTLYREYAEGKEDRDFAMQNVAKGLGTARSTLFAFGAPQNGSNAGGLKETFYAVQGRELLCCQRLVELWPGACKHITKDDGRNDVKINWKALRPTAQSSLF